MVYKLKPLELGLDFDDRDYELGDTIDIRVELTPNGDVDVREARADLVCEQRYTRNESGIAMGMGGSGVIQGGRLLQTTDYVPSSSWVSERTESYVHSSVAFLKGELLRSGVRSTRTVRLQVEPGPPPRLDDAQDLQRDAKSAWSFKWRLVASVNIVRGRDPRRQRTVRIRLPEALLGADTSSKPRMSTPRKRTGQPS
jgi:hypothetical protein